MKLSNLLTAILLSAFFALQSFAQTTNDFRSVTSGNWSVNTTWERYDGSTWVTPASGTFPGSGANNGNVLIRDGHTVTTNATVSNAVSSLTVGEGASGILNIGAFAITITGATDIAANGTVNVTSATGTKTFTGNFTNNGTWNNSGNSPITMTGSIANNGTFTAGTAAYTLNATGARTIAGTITFGSITQTTAGPYTNNGTITVTGTHSITTSAGSFVNAGTYSNSSNLTMTTPGSFTNNNVVTISGATFGGTGTFINGANATLNLNSAPTGPTTLNLAASGNTVRYGSAATQTVRSLATYVNLEISNSHSSGATLGGAVGAVSLVINSGGTLSLNGQTLSVSGNLDNNGTLLSNTGTLTMNGTAAQVIQSSGSSGVWSVSGNTGRLLNLTINNSNNSNVSLNVDLAIQNNLTLTNGVLTGSGTLTIGVPATAVTVSRALGALASVPAFGYTTGAYAINYTSASTYNAQNELPASGTPTNGILTVNISGAVVNLDKTANIGRLATVAGATFNLNNFTLGLSDATALSNAGTLNATGTTSILRLNGTVAQTLTAAGTLTAPGINKVVVSNAHASGVSMGGALNLAYLEIESGALFNLNGQTLTMRNDLNNNGTFVSTTGTLTMAGAVAQVIESSGSTGVWSVSGNNGRLLNLTINNSTNANVSLNVDVTIQGNLTLTNGVLTGSGTLTIGATATNVSLTRTGGSLALSPVFGYTSGLYNITYGAGSSISFSTGNELPDASVIAVTGTLVLNVSATGTVTLTKDVAINGTWTNTTGLFSIGANTLTLNGIVTMTAGSFIGGTSSEIVYGGSGNASLVMNNTTPGTSNLLSKLTVNRSSGTVTINTTALIVQDELILTQGALANAVLLTLNGIITSTSGTLSGGAGGLVLGGSSDSMGTIGLTGSSAGFASLVFSNSSTAGTLSSPTVTITGALSLSSAAANTLHMNGNASGGGVLKIDGNLTFSASNAQFNLVSGIVMMGNRVVSYTNNTAATTNLVNSMNTANEKSYFAFLGSNGGFQLNVITNAANAGTYKWPIGPAGSVNGYRPVTIVTAATMGIGRTVKIGFINHSGGTAYSPTNLPATDGSANNNTRGGYIANVTLNGTIGTPNVTMTYQNADFNTTPSAASAVQIYNNNGTQWTSPGAQTSNGTANSNVTITRNSYALSAAGIFPLVLAEPTVSDPGTANTWTWTGITSTSWNASTNWIPASVPNASTANVVIVDATAPNQPILDISAAVNDITVGAGCTLGTSGTRVLTINGTFTNSGTVTPASGSTFTYAGSASQTILPLNYFTLTSSGTGARVLSSTGTIGVATLFTPGSNTYTTTGSTVSFNGTQTFTYTSGFQFNNLTVSAGTLTLGANSSVTINGDLSISAGATFADATNALITGPGTGTFTNSGTLTLVNPATAATTGNEGCFPLFANYAFSAASVVNFNAAAAQNIVALPSPGYGSVSITTAATTSAKTASGAFTIQGSLLVNSATSVFYYGSNTITVNGGITNNGIITGSAGGPGTGKILVTGGTALHTLTTGGTNLSPTYGNLEVDDATWSTTFENISGSSGTTTVAGTFTVTGGTVNIGLFRTALAVSGATVVNGSLVHTNATGIKNYNSDFSVGTTGSFTSSAVAGAVNFAGNVSNSGTFNPSAATGVFSLNGASKTIGGSQPLSFGLLTIGGATAITSGSTVNIASTFAVNAALTNNGTLNSNGTAAITGSSSISNESGATFTLANASIGPSLIPSASANQVTYTGGAAQTVKVPTTNPYFHLSVDKSANAATLGGSITVAGDLTIENGTLQDGSASNSLLITGPGSGSGTFEINNSGIFLIRNNSNPSPMPVFQNYNFTLGSTVNYQADWPQNIAALTYGNLTLGNNSSATGRTKTALGSFSIEGNFNFSAGAASVFALGDNNTVTIKGTITTSNATISSFSGPTSSLVLSGTANTNLPAITNGLKNLTINKTSGGVVAMTGANTISTTLTMEDGVLNVSNQTLTINGAVVNGAGPATFSSVSNNGALAFAGTAGGNVGTLNLTGGSQTFNTLSFTRGGLSPAVTINGNLTLASNTAGALTMNSSGGVLNMQGNLTLSGATAATCTLTNGIVAMGDNTFTYNSTGANMPASAATRYISFLGSNGGFQWNIPNNTAANTYRLPTGVSGDVVGYRPVSLQTTATTSGVVQVKAGFIDHDGLGLSASDIPTTGNNRAGYIATLGVFSGTLPAVNLTMAYQDADFNGSAPAATDVAVYRYSGSLWTRLGNNATGTADGNTTVRKDGVTISTSSSYALAVTGGADLPGNTYTWTGSTSTAWNDPSNWDLNNGAFPNDAADNVIINTGTGNQPVIPNSVTYLVKDISVTNGSTLSIGSGSSGTIPTLRVFGNFNTTSPSAGVVTGLSTTPFSAVDFASASPQTIPPGSYYNITNTGNGNRTLASSGIIGLSGSLTTGTGTYTVTGSTVDFNGSAAQTINAITYNNLNVSNTGVKTLGGSITVNGNIDVSGTATLADIASATITGVAGTFSVGSGASYTTVRTSTPWFPTNLTVALDNNSTVNFNPASATNYTNTIPSSYGHLSFGGGAVAKTLPASFPVTVNGNLSIPTGTLGDNGNTITVVGNVANTGGITGSGTVLLDGGSAHILNGAGGYRGVTLDDTSADISSATTINGNLTITSGTFTAGAFALTVAAASTTSVTGTLAITSATGAKGLGNVTVNNGGTVVTSAAPALSTTNLVVSSGGTWDNSGNAALTISGNLQNDGTFTSGSALHTFSGATKTISGSNAVTVPSATFSGAYTNSGDFTVSGTLTVNSGVTFTNSSELNTTSSTAVAGTGTIVNGSSAIFNVASASITPTLTATASGNTVTYNGSAAQTVKPTTYHHLTLDNSTGNTIGGATVNGTLTLEDGLWAIGANTLTLNGDVTIVSGDLSGGVTSNVAIGGSGSNLPLPISLTSLNNLTINRANGVTLGAPLTLSSSGVLTLTSGVLTISSSNTLTLNNTAAGAISPATPTSASYVAGGPLTRALPGAASGTYTFPVGKSSFNMFELVNPTTSGAGSITVEVFDANAGGTPGPGLTALNTNRYWSAIPSSSFITGARVRLTEGSAGGADRVGQSAASAGGTYNNRFGSSPSPFLSNGVDPALGYFALATSGAVTLSGTYTVGNTGQFLKLTDVATILNSATVTGNVLFELQSDYDGTVGETFPVVFNPFTTSGGSWSAVVRPAAGVSTRTTSGDAGTTNPSVHFNGVDRLTFDGRAGGTGSSIAWVIRNTRTASTVGPAIQLSSGAESNSLRYLQVESQNSQTTSGTILLSAGAGEINQNDTIRNCVITHYSSGATTHLNAIYATGTSGTGFNNSISVLNNSISNFTPTSSGTASGIAVTGSGASSNGYGNNWTISGNSFFKSVNEQNVYQYIVIDFGPSPTGSASTGNVISNNYIGGNANALTGSAIVGEWTTAVRGVANTSPTFQAIRILANEATVSNNKIGSILNTSISSSTSFVGINAEASNASGDLTISGNTIGSTASPGGFYPATSTSSVAVGLGSKTFVTQAGLAYQSGDRVIITNNASSANPPFMVGSVTSYSGTSLVVSVDAISGSGTLASWFINIASGIQNAGQQWIVGIWDQTSATSVISNNTIANLTNTNAVNSVDVTCGIIAQSGANEITDNTIYNLAAACVNTTPTLYISADGSVIGISSQSIYSNAQQIVSGNEIFNLNSTQTGVFATRIVGIEVSGTLNSGIEHICNGNLVHSLTSPNANTAAQHYGIRVDSGNQLVSNNMVRLGIRSDGSSITGSASMHGILEASSGSSSQTVRTLHNSVYIGGSGVASGTVNTYAFARSNSNSSPKTLQDIRNNIFVNQRANASGTGSHFAMGFDNNVNISASDYNAVYGVGSGFQFGQIGSTGYVNKSAWNLANPTWDGNSITNDPNYISPATGTPDLHISSVNPTPIEGAGISGATVAYDYDGQDRSANTPVDIGADAGGFIPVDLTPPSISFTAIADLCNTNPTSVNLSANITDASGVNVTAGTKPRLYYKKSTGANTSAGWLYTEATNAVSPFTFTLDLTALPGGGVVAGETIQYFVVAQDEGPFVPTPNVALLQGNFASAPGNVNLGSSAFPIGGTLYSFSVLPCSGTVTVGEGGNYPGFTPNGGLFQAINAATLTGSLVAEVISDISIENGVHALNQWSESGVGSYTLTIRPDDAVLRTVSGTSVASSAPMIPINGADRVTINGQDGGSGQYLLFRNTNTTAGNTGPVIQFYNGSTQCTLQNTILESNASSASHGVVTFGGGSNTSIAISGNDIRSATGGTTGAFGNGVFSNNTSNSSLTISGNSFYSASTAAFAQNGISLTAGGGNTIHNNYIGGSTSGAGGSAWSHNGASFINGMVLSVGASPSTSVQGNTISNISMTSTLSGAGFSGIQINGGTVDIGTTSGNLIGHGSTANSINCAGQAGMFGIRSASAETVNISNNTIAHLTGTETATSTNQMNGIRVTAGVNSIIGNTIRDLTFAAFNTSAGASASLVGIVSTSSGAGQTIRGNTVHSLKHTTTTTGVSVVGISVSGATSGSNWIEKNKVHSFYLNSTSNSSATTGIYLDGTTTFGVRNNMVRMGILPDGNVAVVSTLVTGIQDNSSGSNAVLFNSVYVGGTAGGVSAANSYAYRRSATAADDIRNNIFSNARTGGASGSRHYSFGLNTTSGSATINANLYHAVSGHLFTWDGGSTTLTTLQAFNSSASLAGQNLGSGVGDPNFVDPTGDISDVDLHITGTSPAESAGVLIASVTDDIDGDVRASNSPTDIGADAGNYSPLDVFNPVISVSAIPSQAPCGSSLTIPVTATITDIGSGVATGALEPRLWWRLSTGTWSSLSPISVTGSTYVYDLVISPVAGQTYEYYVAAQDVSSPANIAYSHFSSVTPVHTDVATFPSTANSSPGTFSVLNVAPLTGVVTVGPGGTYTTFGGVGGLFEAIQNNGLKGNLTAEVIGDITDNNITSLSQWSEYCGSGYTLSIRPSAPTNRVISVPSANGFGFGFIKIQGADRVIIDGSFNGSGNYLTFRNGYSSNANVAGCIYMDGQCQNDTIRNVTIEGQGHHLQGGNLIINTSGGSSVYVDNCVIKGTTSSAVPNNLIYSAASGSGSYTITNCKLYDFSNFGSPSSGQRATALLVSSMLSPTATWTITNNSIYNTFIDGTSSQTALNFSPGTGSNGNLISGNYIGGREPQCGGAAMTNNTLSDFIMMEINVGSDVSNPTTISNNTIQNILAQSGDAGGVTSMWIRGSSRVIIEDNLIGHPTLVNNIQGTGGGISLSSNTGWVYGIYAQTSSPITIQGNTIAGLASVGSFRSYGNSIELTGSGTATITGNTIANSYNGASNTGYNYYGIAFTGTGNQNHVIENNTITRLGSSSSAPNGTYATAIIFNGNNQGAQIRNNQISDLFHVSNGGESSGIHLVGSNANYTISNNFINLDNRSWLNTYTTRKIYYGIHDWTTSGTVNIHYNTILVQGSQTGTSGFDYPSACYYRLPNGSGNTSGASVNLRNNILINARTGNPTSFSLHYTIDNTSTSPGSGWSSNYNLMQNVNPAHLAFWGSSNRTFAQWKSVSSGDANSSSPTYTSGSSNYGSGTLNPFNLFVNSQSDLHISIADGQSYFFVDAQATPLALDVDIDGDNRDDVTPDFGADEFADCYAPLISQQPGSSQQVCLNVSPSDLSVTASNATSYQWYSNVTNSNSGGTSLGSSNGAQTDTYTPPTNAAGTTYYYVIITGACGTTTSNTAAVTVNEAPAITAYSPGPLSSSFVNNVCAGSNTAFGVTATGAGLSYQWEISTNNGGSWGTTGLNSSPYSGSTSGTLTISNIPASLNGAQYRVVVTGTCPSAITSDAGILNVGSVNIDTAPAASTVACNSGNTTISVQASGNNLTYQWYVSTNSGGAWSPISNGGIYDDATTSTLQINGVTPTLDGYWYRVIVGTTACSPITSSHSVLTVAPSTALNSQPLAWQTRCQGNSPINLVVAAAGSTLSYQWYSNVTNSNSGGTSLGNGNGAQTATYTPSTATVGTTYYYVVVSGTCSSVTSNTAQVTVTAQPTWYLDADSDGYASFSVSACNNPGVGYSLVAKPLGDCFDNNPDINPGANEWCNGLDDDCDGFVDEGMDLITFYQDSDGDGYGNAMSSVEACEAPSGYVANNTDCNDSNSAIRPGATELNDDLDNDCDGLVDEGFGPVNDNKNTALVLPISPAGQCNPVNGTVVDASVSPQGGATIVTGEDVWYYFQSNMTAARIECVSSSFDALIELQNSGGTVVDVENVISGTGNEFMNVEGLTPGETYYVRVRNYNSAQGSGSFTLCLRPLRGSQCNSGPGPYSLCNTFKSTNTGANLYIFNFTPSGGGPTYSVTMNGVTTLALSSVNGLLYGSSYNVSMTVVYNLQNSAGTPEVITVPSTVPPCLITTSVQPDLDLREVDQCAPNGSSRARNAVIGANTWLCGASNYQWEFTPILPSGLAFTGAGQGINRFIALGTVPLITEGTRYAVRIRPMFMSGTVGGDWGPDTQCLQIIGSAGMTEEETSEGEIRRESNGGKMSLVVYPNPLSGDQLRLDMNGLRADKVNVRILDATGRRVFTAEYTGDRSLSKVIEFDQPLSAGVYLIEVSNDGEIMTERIMVQR